MAQSPLLTLRSGRYINEILPPFLQKSLKSKTLKDNATAHTVDQSMWALSAVFDAQVIVTSKNSH